MPAYSYDAVDINGKNKKGVVAAASVREARSNLKAKQLFPTRVSLAAGDGKAGTDAFAFLKISNDHISPADVVIVLRQFATIIRAGSPVEEALSSMISQADKPSQARVFTRIRANVLEGMALSDAMAQEVRSFPRHITAMVQTGEVSGDLGLVLSRIADQAEKAQDMNARVQAALVYPIVLAIVAVGIIAALMTFVVPRVVSQFENFGADLPTITKIVVGTSEFMASYGVFLFAGIAALVAAFVTAMQVRSFKLGVHTFLLKIPLIGSLARKADSARFARTMGTLVTSGSPVLDSLTSAAATMKNVFLQQELSDVAAKVREGGSLSKALQANKIFTPMVATMAATGEKSGELGSLMLTVADYLDRDFDQFTKTALSLLEPLIVIIMGGVVGVIVMAIMLPILQLNSLVLG